MTFRVELAPGGGASAAQTRSIGPQEGASGDRTAGRAARPGAATQLVGGDGAWRVRTGDYRIVYESHDDVLLVLLVLVVAAGHRRDIYRRR